MSRLQGVAAQLRGALAAQGELELGQLAVRSEQAGSQPCSLPAEQRCRRRPAACTAAGAAAAALAARWQCRPAAALLPCLPSSMVYIVMSACAAHAAAAAACLSAPARPARSRGVLGAAAAGARLLERAGHPRHRLAARRPRRPLQRQRRHRHHLWLLRLPGALRGQRAGQQRRPAGAALPLRRHRCAAPARHGGPGPGRHDARLQVRAAAGVAGAGLASCAARAACAKLQRCCAGLGSVLRTAPAC